MSNWAAFALVCDALREGLLGGRPVAIPPDSRWELVAGVSSHHLVTPALAWCLRDADIAEEPRDFLAAILQLNTERNAGLTETLERVVTLLAAAGIVPVLLKGAAALATGLYPAPGVRVIGDIDALVLPEQLGEAETALRSAGFEVVEEAGTSAGHHHLPPLRDPATGAAVELHRRVTFKSEAAFPTTWFREGALEVAVGERRALVLEPTRAIAHVVVHSEISDGGDARQTLRLRSLLEFARLRHQHGAEIDWTDLDRRFGAAGAGRALATQAVFAEALFGQPFPPLTHKPRPRAVETLRGVIDRPAARARVALWQRLSAVAETLRREPGTLGRKLMDPGLLPRQVRLLMQAFRTRRW